MIQARDEILPPYRLPSHLALLMYCGDLGDIDTLLSTRYLNPRRIIPKAPNLHLAFHYEESGDIDLFQQMLRVSPRVFRTVLHLIKDDPVFHNHSNNDQTPVEYQLAVTLFRLGRYGNAASIMDVARNAGVSAGSVHNFTMRCLQALGALNDIAFRKPTVAEKEREKRWITARVGFRGLWSEGWLMYDGTIAIITHEPKWHGDAYYGRKMCYGFNVQVCLMIAC